MTDRIRQCPIDHIYTLLKTCPKCGAETANASPARYSPQDRYGKYRRMVREWNR
ncbi:MAG: RNA-protein complex protein Nop10 [Methanocalculaceae archaeon]|nr:RNA-protein complex protein Nop10 [Methanocalculaceae archaeon]